MFEPGNFGQVIKEDPISLLSAKKGEWTTQEVRVALGKICERNPAFTYYLLTGEQLFPFQSLKIKTMWQRDSVLDISARGGAKSWTAALFALLYAIFNPGIKILVLGPSYKQACIILEYILEYANKTDAHILRQLLRDSATKNAGTRGDKFIKRGSDRTTVYVGKSQIFALPLGDGKKIRGARAQVIILDEFFAIPEIIVDEVIGPMMVVKGDIAKRRERKQWEDRMIKAGKMTEEERFKFPNNKLIGLSSASYQFEPLYKRFSNYCDAIQNTQYKESREFQESDRTYGIINFGWEVFPEEMLDRNFIMEQKNKLSASSFQREYEAQFCEDSKGYFRMQAMMNCTIEMGDSPIIEIKGDNPSDWVYILGIDPNYKNAENSDHFAMCLIKAKRNELHKGYVVHNYAVAGFDLSTTIFYLYYLLKNFPSIEYIIVDAGGGHSFFESVNNSKLFSDNNMKLEAFEAEFEKGTQEAWRKGKQSYAPKIGKMVHYQQFSGNWIQMANQYLQSAFDHKKIYFAAPPMDDNFEAMLKEDIPIENIHYRLDKKDSFVDLSGKNLQRAKQIDFIEHQKDLIELTKQECANIEVSITSQGHQSFDLPRGMRKQDGPDKPRKDSYSALLLANWGLKCYRELHDTPEPPKQYGFAPRPLF